MKKKSYKSRYWDEKGRVNKAKTSEEKGKNAEDPLPVVGETRSFDSYRRFQRSQATASDLDTVIMLRTAIAKGEAPKKMSPVVWGITIFIILLAVVIGLYLLSDFGILPEFGGGGGGSKPTETVQMMINPLRVIG